MGRVAIFVTLRVRPPGVATPTTVLRDPPPVRPGVVTAHALARRLASEGPAHVAVEVTTRAMMRACGKVWAPRSPAVGRAALVATPASGPLASVTADVWGRW